MELRLEVRTRVDVSRDQHEIQVISVRSAGVPFKVIQSPDASCYRQSMDANGKPKHGTLNQTKVILVAYGGSRIKHLGTVKIPCNLKGRKTIAITFCIIDTEGPAIMGLYTATELNLTKFNLKI